MLTSSDLEKRSSVFPFPRPYITLWFPWISIYLVFNVAIPFGSICGHTPPGFPPWCHGSVWTLRRTGNPAVHRPQRQKLTVTSLQRRLHDRRWWCPNLQRRLPYTLGCTDHKNGSMKFKCPKISYIYGCPVCACKNRCSNTYYGRMVHLVKSQTHNT